MITAGSFGKAVGGTATWHAMFKGINIDEVNPVEKEVTYWHTGCHAWGISSWNFGEQHNILTTTAGTTGSTSVYSWLLETALRNGGRLFIG
jgi:hypothetical protein